MVRSPRSAPGVLLSATAGSGSPAPGKARATARGRSGGNPRSGSLGFWHFRGKLAQLAKLSPGNLDPGVTTGGRWARAGGTGGGDAQGSPNALWWGQKCICGPWPPHLVRLRAQTLGVSRALTATERHAGAGSRGKDR